MSHETTKDNINPFKAVDFMRDNAKLLADAEYRINYLGEFIKVKRAILMLASQAKTETAKENEAKAHPEYLELVKAHAQAKSDFVELRWLMIGAQSKIEIWRSLESSARAEGKSTQ